MEASACSLLDSVLSGVSSLSVRRFSEVQALNRVQSWEVVVCFNYGQRGHTRRFFPLRVDISDVSESSQTLSHQSSRGRY